LVIVVDSISFQLPIAQLPISAHSHIQLRTEPCQRHTEWPDSGRHANTPGVGVRRYDFPQSCHGPLHLTVSQPHLRRVRHVAPSERRHLCARVAHGLRQYQSPGGQVSRGQDFGCSP